MLLYYSQQGGHMVYGEPFVPVQFVSSRDDRAMKTVLPL